MGSDPVSAALIALLLGLVQGATEFLPISSSAHLYAIPYLFGISDPLFSSLAFAAVIHLGTLAAVLVALRSDVTRLTRVALRIITSLGRHRGDSADERLILAIIIGTIPAVVFGIAAGDLLEGAVRTPLVVAGAVTAGALLLWFAERVSTRERPLQSVGVIDLKKIPGSGSSRRLVSMVMMGTRSSHMKILIQRSFHHGPVSMGLWAARLLSRFGKNDQRRQLSP